MSYKEIKVCLGTHVSPAEVDQNIKIWWTDGGTDSGELISMPCVSGDREMTKSSNHEGWYSSYRNCGDDFNSISLDSYLSRFDVVYVCVEVLCVCVC